MRTPDADLERLIAAIREVKERIILCSVLQQPHGS
jgi:hypothetical protein